MKTSLLSSDSPEQRYRGLMNLGMLMLLALNLRNIIDNIVIYGNRLDLISFQLTPQQIAWVIMMVCVQILIGWGFFSIIWRKKLVGYIILAIGIGASFLVLLLCGFFIRYAQPFPFVGIAICIFCMALTLKYISFFHFIYELSKVYNFIDNQQFNH